jgi:hypothetical protein
VLLNAKQRASVEKAIRETCSILHWGLYTVNVRTNHINSVVSSRARPDRILRTLKADSTRMMRMAGCWTYDHSPWSDRESKRYLCNERSLELAIDYVINGQGRTLPNFDAE